MKDCFLIGIRKDLADKVEFPLAIALPPILTLQDALKAGELYKDERTAIARAKIPTA